MITMAKARQTMMRSPVKYHIGAAYFTGEDRTQLEVTGEDCLGRLGSFISAIYGSSTLFQSHVTSLEGHVRSMISMVIPPSKRQLFLNR